MWGFPVFDWFPDRVIISFKGRDVCSKGCIPHVTERRFEVATCLVIKSSAVGCMNSLPGGPGFSLCGHESLNCSGCIDGLSLCVPGWSGFLSGLL